MFRFNRGLHLNEQCISRSRKESGCARDKKQQKEPRGFLGFSGTIDLQSLFYEETLGASVYPYSKSLFL